MDDKPLPITVTIVAKNEADRLPLALKSVAGWVQRVIVVDSGSTDGTQQIAQDLGAEVVFNQWQGANPQKCFAQSLAQTDWVMMIDADEEVSPQLKAEIAAAIAEGPLGADAYRFPLLAVYNFQKKLRPITVHRYPIKLYRKSKGGFRAERDPYYDTAEMQPDARIDKLRGMLNHYSFRSLYDHVDKANWSSENQAANLYKRGKKPGLLVLFITPPLAFFKQFILRKECLNGIDGVIVSYMFAFQRFIRLAKSRERFQGGPWGPHAKLGMKEGEQDPTVGIASRGDEKE
ncbi:MAG: glycosyltransferase family 2 protein [Planctomycetota bacterium]